MSQLENRKYVSFSHTFSDPWSGDSAEEAQDVTLSFRFAKPTKLQIQRLQDKAAKNAGQASRNLVLDCVHPDDRQALTASPPALPRPSSRAWAFPPNWETSAAPGCLRAGGRADSSLAALCPV